MPRILHFGLGNFHRAHQAYYTEMANRLGGRAWRITGVSLRSAAVRDALVPQDCAYTLAISEVGKTRYERIEAIETVLVSGADTDAIIAALADPHVQIVSLTVTEKGYHLDPSGALNLEAPEVRGDLGGGTRTIYGYLTQGFRKRMAAGAGPVTVLSCDNLSGNGQALSAALDRFIGEADPALRDWIGRSVTFPSSMVDRITPATTDALRDEVSAATGWQDRAPVATEGFSEWVIEDRFASARPDWDRVGVQLVGDVAPFELRKLRMLNGAHSWLAYAGVLAGHNFVHEAVADPALAAGARGIMDETATTLPESVRQTASDYGAALIRRFANPALKHRLRQIAMDGSQKIPVRLVATWQDRHRDGLSSPAVEAGIAAWLDFLTGELAEGRLPDDPLAEDIARLSGQHPEKKGFCDAVLGLIGAPDALAARLARA